MSTEEKEEKPYSYHTFLYTFTYTGESLGQTKEKKIGPWERIKNIADILKEGSETKETWDAYNSVCYFTPKTKNAIFNTDEGKTCVNYRYDLPEKSDYVIGITGGQSISVPIEEIKLTMYPKVKVGVVSISIKYVEKSSGNDNLFRIKKVAAINENGRRLYYPNRGKREDGVGSFIKTSSLGICSDDADKNLDFTTDFENQYKENKEKNHIEDIKPSFIDELLGNDIKVAYGIENLSSVFDDRMFTCSLVVDDFISEEMKKFNVEKSEYAYYLHGQKITNTKIDTSTLLYGYTFIDDDLTSCTCQNKNYRIELLKKHIYDRWIDYGTIYGFTEYSMTCITNEGGREIAKASFLTQYIEMVKLCLVQRAAINVIEKDIVDSCKSIQLDEREGIDPDRVSKIWERYIVFQNELFIPEVSFQEQGVEIYAFLKKFLKLEELNAQIGEELDNLHELTQLQESKRNAENEAKKTFWMKVFNLLLSITSLKAILDLVERIFKPNENNVEAPYLHWTVPLEVIIGIEKILTVIFVVLLFAIFVVLLFYTFSGRKKRKDKTKEKIKKNK